MEQHDPSRRQYAPNTYAAQQVQQQGDEQISGQYGSTASSDRFRQGAFIQQAQAGASSTAGRGSHDLQQVYGYAQGGQYGTVPALQPSALQYSQDLQAQDLQRQQQQAQYQQYSASAVYGMAQPQNQQQPTPSVFEQVPQYRQRPSGASETLTAQFGVPQTSQYFLAAQGGSASAAASELASQHIPSQYAQPSYPQPGPSTTQPYPNTMIDPSQSGAYTTYSQQSQYNAQQPSQSVDQAFNDYQARVRSIFTLVRDGTLRDIGSHLQYISQYLLGNAEALGLTRDDHDLHDDRIRLWDEFNRAWLTTLQRQFDLTQEMIQHQQPLGEPRSIMASQTLEHLSRELVALCDNVEPRGLVDYQMGVAEEQIMDLLLRCLSLLDPPGHRPSESGPQTESSAAAAARGR